MDSSTTKSLSPDSNGPLFLGIDVSTQSTKASLLSSSLELLSELAINFDRDLPQYKTSGGVLTGSAGSGEIHSPALMAVESLDLLAEKILAAGWPTQRVKAVSAAGQQHASVYWSRRAPEMLRSVNGSKRLVDQLGSQAFSRAVIPNWQDSSTTAECKAFEAHVGGPTALAKITGSKAYERFTGPQIMRWRREEPEAYEQTERIGLVSSMVTTLLCAGGEGQDGEEIKGIDESDACGMNLWDLSTPERGWSRPLLELVAGGDAAAADELARKLGAVESDGGRIVGRIGRWWQEKLNFSPDCLVCPATGDNPATLLSLALAPREAMVSLGTSDTLLIPAPSFEPSEAFHVFYHPARVAGSNASESEEGGQGEVVETSSRYFNMLVYKNGSLAREAVRDKYCASSWREFDRAVRSAWPGRDSVPQHTGFYWFKEEIIPPNAKGVHLYTSSKDGQWSRAEEFEAPATHPHSIISSQLLSFKNRVGAILHENAGSDNEGGLVRIHATGGASSNQTLLETMADVLACPVVRPQQQGNACSVGAALKARWAWERATKPGRERVAFDVCVEEARKEGEAAEQGGQKVKLAAEPDEARTDCWRRFLPTWEELERRALRGE